MNVRIKFVRKLTRIKAILIKERIELFRNYKILIIFALFPIVLAISLSLEVSGAWYMIMMMGVILPPIVCMASQISEEREKGVLRGLIFAGLKWHEYIFGMVFTLWILTSLDFCAMATIAKSFTGIELGDYVIFVFLLGEICSLLIGAIIGITSKNQAGVSVMTIIVGMGLVFSAILGTFSTNIHHVTKILYSQILVDAVAVNTATYKQLFIVVISIIVAVLLFWLAFRRRRSED